MKELIKKQYEECRKAYEGLSDKTSAAALQLLGAIGAYEELCPELKEDEDEKLINNLISTLSNLYARNLIKKETKEKYINLLKSLKDRVQPKQKWSDDDEKRMNHIIQFLEDKDRWKDSERAFPIEEDIRWLKDIKPQNRWKPTIAQMRSLKEHVDFGGGGWELTSLYTDLIKLL